MNFLLIINPNLKHDRLMHNSRSNRKNYHLRIEEISGNPWNVGQSVVLRRFGCIKIISTICRPSDASVMSLLFDYNRWNRPFRYIKNNRFEQAPQTKNQQPNCLSHSGSFRSFIILSIQIQKFKLSSNIQKS
ncbi:hypothetical protein RND71_003380 [Anisodus tanguticus]|uniref:Protein TIC 214 n=1 Tax=Anisodus tanguticus TaxID=243964 RepID=A0AAE1SUH1_9SOLA|nr:hypothetical protein RND71_003380 [Anisodus tanguticus]